MNVSSRIDSGETCLLVVNAVIKMETMTKPLVYSEKLWSFRSRGIDGEGFGAESLLRAQMMTGSKIPKVEKSTTWIAEEIMI